MLISPAVTCLYELLKLTSHRGTVMIKCDPEVNAAIYLDGRDTRLTTPNKLLIKQSENKYNVEVRLHDKEYQNDYPPKEIYVYGGTEKEYTFRNWP